mmetsp:Transcript_64905/g.141448  ORF Transcript_64905/g.141448 Transcript_64905/m.141448 type:complete len:203 (+) Transcript_64905:2-610(+)
MAVAVIREPFVLVDNSLGLATSLLWTLKSRLAGALVLNCCGFFTEEYLDSVAHQKLAEIFRRRAEDQRKLDRDIDAVGDTIICIMLAGTSDLMAEVEQEWKEAARSADEEFWRLSNAHYDWFPRERTEAMSGLPKLQLEATLAASSHGPTVVMTESMRNLSRLLPKSNLAHIPNSKCWWELENPKFVIRELVALMGRLQSLK